jgi:hypothetical protein
MREPICNAGSRNVPILLHRPFHEELIMENGIDPKVPRFRIINYFGLYSVDNNELFCSVEEVSS